jgi:hypothetical protein
MTDQPGAQGTTEPQAGEAAPKPEPTETTPLSNADAKNLPWVQEMGKELKALREEKAARLAAEEQSRKEAEIKKAEAEGRYEDAMKAKQAEIDSINAKYKTELTQRDVTAELLKAGFKNETFLRGAVTGYDAEKSTIADYVAELAKDEANKMFLGEAVAPVLTPPTGSPGTGPPKALTVEQLHALENSTDREERKKAREYLRQYREKHGKYPD